jgi:hypothetical protein
MISAHAHPRLIAAALGAGALTAAVFGVVRPGNAQLFPAGAGDPGVTVYLVNNGFHSDLVLPTTALAVSAGTAARALKALSPAPWVAVGWGDAKFYTESGFSTARAQDALRALFGWRNPSVVMLEPLPAAPERLYRDGVSRLTLSQAGFAGLVRRLDGAFVTDGPAPVAYPASGWGMARFFRSGERFSIAHLCNHWAGELLNAAGVPTRPVLDTLAFGLAMDVGRAAPAPLDRTAPGR